ncbi:MAG: altronate hydrolase [Alphaproteobacteria bacterium]|nr:altronate hydrolase [Alphaproteobacteria bacterium]
MSFLGYQRSDGSAGIRNWVGVMSVMDNCNPVTRAICDAVAGTIPITTLFVRGQYGKDLKISYDTLGGMGRNANLHAVIVVGLERTSTEEVAGRIRNSGKPVETIIIQDLGSTVTATAEGMRKAAKLAIAASHERRIALPESLLTIGVECGGSDTTSGLAGNPCVGRVADRIIDLGGRIIISETAEFLGAEDLFAARAIDAGVKKAFLDRVRGHEAEAMKQGVDIRGANPVPDNIRGGLTTIEEKALGAMIKAGTRPLVGVLDYSEAPSRAGLHFMATPAPAVESMTGLAAGGCQMIMFATGVGNTIGNMVSPTIKVTGNTNTARTFTDNVDFDVSDVLEKGKTITELGDRLYEFVIGVASGSLTTSEVLGQRETAISRFGPTI